VAAVTHLCRCLQLCCHDSLMIASGAQRGLACYMSVAAACMRHQRRCAGAQTRGPRAQGIVFSVRPPKKSWKNIANLSGGEKTLSSLALVFALHHYRPTPLYVMDEIDAALGARRMHAGRRAPLLVSPGRICACMARLAALRGRTRPVFASLSAI